MTTDGGDRQGGAPRFDVVLRGYDRRQVDEYVTRLQRALARARADLEVARSQGPPPPRPPGPGAPPIGGPPGARPPRPAPGPPPRPRPGPPMPAAAGPPPVPPPGPPAGPPDVIGSFTDRMQSILQAAEEEAAEIRSRAHADVESDSARAELADLVRERGAVLAELTRLRGQLEGMLTAPTAPGMPAHRPGGGPPPVGAEGPPRGDGAATTGPAGERDAADDPAPAPTPGDGAAAGPAGEPSETPSGETPTPSGPEPESESESEEDTAASPGTAASVPGAEGPANGRPDVESTARMRARSEVDLFEPPASARRSQEAVDPPETAVPRPSRPTSEERAGAQPERESERTTAVPPVGGASGTGTAGPGSATTPRKRPSPRPRPRPDADADAGPSGDTGTGGADTDEATTSRTDRSTSSSRSG